jgi:hypothetical protein
MKAQEAEQNRTQFQIDCIAFQRCGYCDCLETKGKRLRTKVNFGSWLFRLYK